MPFIEPLDTGDCSSTTAARTMMLSTSSLLLLSLPSLAVDAADFYGFVRFFNHPEFVASGSQYYYYVSEAQQCVNLSCYNDKATSIECKNLPSDGAVESDGKTRIAFFTGMNCTGTKREWSIEDEDFPYDLAMDGIDNDVTSFIIYVDSREKKSSVLPCPWGMELF